MQLVGRKKLSKGIFHRKPEKLYKINKQFFSNRAIEELERKMQAEANKRQRRPSRFEVIPAPDFLKLRQQLSNNELHLPVEQRYHHPVFGIQPKKSILKKTNSFNLRNFGLMTPPHVTPYTTVTGAESRYVV